MNKKEILKLADESSEWLDTDVIIQENVINFFKDAFKIDYIYAVKSQYDYESASIEAIYRHKKDAFDHLVKLNSIEGYSDFHNWIDVYRVI